ncbi:MAG: polysaccharide deacetylase family protein [Clostridiales bacterium]|nr:polysaccharide deacetylase family protein [Clostridiales bacterium]
MLKKIAVFFLIMVLFAGFVSCTKVKPQKIEEGMRGSTGGQVQNNDSIERKPVAMEPPKSFIDSSKFHMPADKIYYTKRAVVLTYHHISLKPFSGITIRPERFEADLKMLKNNYFNVISLRDLINSMGGKDKMPPNAVVITFDDGYESFYKYAYPLLKKYNFPAASFVITSWVDKYSHSTDELSILSSNEIREMYKSGLIDIQSHSDGGHYYIKTKEGKERGALAYQIYDGNRLESEGTYRKRVSGDLSRSISLIKSFTGNTSDILCFPFGHYNQRLVEIAQGVGFKYFVTTVSGYNSEGSKSIYIRRIRSGDRSLNLDKLKANIISCGRGRSLKK